MNFRKEITMGKDLLGKELGTGIRQLPNGKYTARYNNKLGVRKQLYDWDLQKFVHRNPMRGIRIPHDPHEPRVLTEEEQILFFDACKGTFYDNLFVTAVNTGLRQGELAALTWNDIDFENKEIDVNKTLVYQQYEGDDCKTFHVGPPKTVSSNRKVPINRQCEIALKKQYILRNNVWARDYARINEDCGDLVFVTKMGAPMNAQNFTDAIRAVLRVVNEFRDPLEQIEEFSSHCFRHTFATRCFEGGVSMKTVQNILGHASISMTMDLYTHILDKHKVDEMSKIQDEFDRIESGADDMVDKKFEEYKEKEEDMHRKLIDLNRYNAKGRRKAL